MNKRLSLQIEIEEESHVYFSVDRDSDMFYIDWRELSEVDKVKLSIINEKLQRIREKLLTLGSKRTAPAPESHLPDMA
jgi:hypothetical protein